MSPGCHANTFKVVIEHDRYLETALLSRVPPAILLTQILQTVQVVVREVKCIEKLQVVQILDSTYQIMVKIQTSKLAL